MATHLLPRSTPLAEGLDPRAVSELLDALHEVELHSLTVLRHGRVVAEGHWSPWTADDAPLVYSLSKTFTGAAIGICMDQGLFGPDDLLVDHYPEFRQDADEVTASIRVRDCLAMATGHDHDLVDWERDPELGPRAVQRVLATPAAGRPGVDFCYNQLATYAVAGLVHGTGAQDVVEVLREHVFDPLGVPPLSWVRDGQGHPQGFSGLRAQPESVAAFFQLLLDGGVQHLPDGSTRRLLPAAWVEEHRRRQVETRPREQGQGKGDWEQGYGWQCWMATHGYRGDGAFGQFGLVLPEQDMVVVCTAEETDMQRIVDAVWQHLLPGVDRPGEELDERELAIELESLSLMPWTGNADDLAGDPVELACTVEGLDTDPVLVTADGRRIPVGLGQWRRSTLRLGDGVLHLAASGRRLDEQLGARILVLDTPHSLVVHTGPRGWARWRNTPLDRARTLFDLRVRDREREPGHRFPDESPVDEEDRG